MGIPCITSFKKAKNNMKEAKDIHNKSMDKVKDRTKKTASQMKRLRKYELNIIHTFKTFSNLFEKIHNTPEFKKIEIGSIRIPKYDPKKIKKVSVKTEVWKTVLESSFSGGAATVVAMLVGTSAVPLVGPFAATIVAIIKGKITLKKSNKALHQAKKNKEKADKICDYLDDLSSTADSFKHTLKKVYAEYKKNIKKLDNLINKKGVKNYDKFTDDQKVDLENTVLLVIMLYNMCKVKLVKKSDKKNEINKINHDKIKKITNDAKTLLKKVS